MSQLNAISLDTIKRIVESHKHKEEPVKLMLQEIHKELGYVLFEAELDLNGTKVKVAVV